MFISFFFKRYKRKKTVMITIATTTDSTSRRRRGQGRAGPASSTVVSDDVSDEFVLESGEPLSAEEQEIAAVLEENDAEEGVDESGQEEHDKKIVETLRMKAVRDMAERNITILAAEQKEAEGIFPKVYYSSSQYCF